MDLQSGRVLKARSPTNPEGVLISCNTNTQRLKGEEKVAHTYHDEVQPHAQPHDPGAYRIVARNAGPTSHLSDAEKEWLSHQRLEADYKAQLRRLTRAIDPVAQQAVVDMDITQFVQPITTPGQITTENTFPRESLFSEGPLPVDLNFSLRNFLEVKVIDPNVLFARIAVMEGRTKPGYIAPLPEPRLVMSESEMEVGEGSETCGGQ